LYNVADGVEAGGWGARRGLLGPARGAAAEDPQPAQADDNRSYGYMPTHLCTSALCSHRYPFLSQHGCCSNRACLQIQLIHGSSCYDELPQVWEESSAVIICLNTPHTGGRRRRCEPATSDARPHMNRRTRYGWSAHQYGSTPPSPCPGTRPGLRKVLAVQQLPCRSSRRSSPKAFMPWTQSWLVPRQPVPAHHDESPQWAAMPVDSARAPSGAVAGRRLQGRLATAARCLCWGQSRPQG
jgi:hypothetical protein